MINNLDYIPYALPINARFNGECKQGIYVYGKNATHEY